MRELWSEQAKFQAAAEKAIDLDSGLAEAHLTLGATRLWLDHDWKAADRAFQRAIELAPNDATTRQHYAQCLAWVGRTTAAIREARHAGRIGGAVEREPEEEPRGPDGKEVDRDADHDLVRAVADGGQGMKRGGDDSARDPAEQPGPSRLCVKAA